MKNTKTVIPMNLRQEMEVDPFYKTCSLYGQLIDGVEHKCEGRVTWEHAMIYAGKKIQKKWAIIPLCEKGHAVDNFQDAGTMVKDANQWVALNRATRAELEEYTHPDIMFNKVDYFNEKERLNALYGVYTHKIPQPVVSPIQNIVIDIKNKPEEKTILNISIPEPLSIDIIKYTNILKILSNNQSMNPAQFILEAIVIQIEVIKRAEIMLKNKTNE